MVIYNYNEPNGIYDYLDKVLFFNLYHDMYNAKLFTHFEIKQYFTANFFY